MEMKTHDSPSGHLQDDVVAGDLTSAVRLYF